MITDIGTVSVSLNPTGESHMITGIGTVSVSLNPTGECRIITGIGIRTVYRRLAESPQRKSHDLWTQVRTENRSLAYRFENEIR